MLIYLAVQIHTSCDFAGRALKNGVPAEDDHGGGMQQ